MTSLGIFYQGFNMAIWHKSPDLGAINKFNENCLIDHIDIQVTEFTDDSLIGTMPVNSKVHQPFGILHGGASCVLAESLGSIASNLCLDNSKHYAVGLEINANHVRSVTSGVVKAIAKNIHLGRKTHIWDIKVYDEDEKLVCISRLTMAVMDRS